MTIALGNFAIMYSTLVRFANELVLISYSEKQGHCVQLSLWSLFTNFPDSLGYYFIAYCNILHKYPRNFYPYLILIVTVMNKSKVLKELSLHWQSLTSID